MANTIIQLRRSSVAGRTPNTTTSANSQYINAGELGLNMTDKLLYSSDGTNLITIGQNTTSLTVGNSSLFAISANSANIVFGLNVAVTANGLVGTAGQLLTSNGTGLYWSTPGATGTNVNATYAWTNTQSFSNTITFTGPILANTVNAASYNVGTAFTANATLVNAAAINVVGQTNTATLFVTTSANVGTAFTVNSTVLAFTGGNVTATTANLAILNAVVSGNLTVGGTVTTINASQLTIIDPIVEFGSNNQLATADIVDSGFFLPANAAGVASPYYSGIARIASRSSNTNAWFWIFASNTNPNTATTIDTSTNTATGTLQAYLAPYGSGGAFIVNTSVMNITANTTVSANISANSISFGAVLAGTIDCGAY